MTRISAWMIAAALTATSLPAAHAQNALAPLSKVVSQGVSDCRAQPTLSVPMITWAGDFVTVHANGGDVAKTAKDSPFDALGVSANLYVQDDFKRQMADYLACKTPFLRGTQGMINMAAELTERDPRTKMVVIYQLTWSMGDHLVARAGIKQPADLKGKTIAIQAYGPHIDFMGRILRDAGLTTRDVKLRFVDQLTGANSPFELMQRDASVDAAFVVTPDMLTATAGGGVGTGAEGSINGASVLVSTKTANRIISDVYAVRSDFFQANRDQIKNFIHALFLAEEEFRGEMRGLSAALAGGSKLAANQTAALDRMAKIFKLPSPEEAGNFWLDAESTGYKGNVRWIDANAPRSYQRLNNEIQPVLVSLGLLPTETTIAHAGWDYAAFREGLSETDGVEQPRFNEAEVARAVTQRVAQGTLGDDTLFEFEVNFKPNQKDFSADLYREAFIKVIDLATTYGGAVITVEGHSDPMRFLELKQKNAPPLELRRQRQAAKTLATSRALNVRDTVIRFATERNVPLDPSQFAIVGLGFDQPKTGLCGADPCPPKTEAEFLSNLRVVFRIVNLEAEAAVFRPLN